jgi:hypothetical protein
VAGFLFQVEPMSEQPETESPSIEDRLLAQFEPEQPETEAPAEQQEETQEAAPESEAQPEFVEHEYEGKTYQVPPELKDALMRQADYTRKTTETADRQRAIEQKELQLRASENERAFHQKVKDDITNIQKIDFQIEQWKSVDVTGMSSEELWKVSRQVDQLKEKRAEHVNGINGKYQAYQNEQAQLQQEALSKAQESVAKLIKGWGPESQKAIREYALSEGYTSPELDSLTDPRLVKTLWKAQQFDKLQAQQVQGKVRTVPTVKPGSSNPMPQQLKDQFALKKQLNNPKLTSSQKAKAIERELMNRF